MEYAEKVILQAPDWNFEGDCMILNWMEQISQNLTGCASKTKENLNKLSKSISRAHIALENTQNNLTALQYNQYVEMRCQEDEGTVESEKSYCKAESKTSDQILKEFLDNNLKMLYNCHDKYDFLEDSDQDDNETANFNCVYQPKNPYNEHLLPHIFGTKMWKENWHVGLCHDDAMSYSGDESSDKYSTSSPSSEDNISIRSHNTTNLSHWTSSTSLTNENKNKTITNLPRVAASVGTSNTSTSLFDEPSPVVNIPTQRMYQEFTKQVEQVLNKDISKETPQLESVKKTELVNPTKKKSLQCRTLNLFDDSDYRSLISEIVGETETKEPIENTEDNQIQTQPQPNTCPRVPRINLFDSRENSPDRTIDFNQEINHQQLPFKSSNQNISTNLFQENTRSKDKVSQVQQSLVKPHSPAFNFDHLDDADQINAASPISKPKASTMTKISAKSLFDDDDENDDFLSIFGKKNQNSTPRISPDKVDDSLAKKSSTKVVLFPKDNDDENRDSLFFNAPEGSNRSCSEETSKDTKKENNGKPLNFVNQQVDTKKIEDKLFPGEESGYPESKKDKNSMQFFWDEDENDDDFLCSKKIQESDAVKIEDSTNTKTFPAYLSMEPPEDFENNTEKVQASKNVNLIKNQTKIDNTTIEKKQSTVLANNFDNFIEKDSFMKDRQRVSPTHDFKEENKILGENTMDKMSFKNNQQTLLTNIFDDIFEKDIAENDHQRISANHNLNEEPEIEEQKKSEIMFFENKQPTAEANIFDNFVDKEIITEKQRSVSSIHDFENKPASLHQEQCIGDGLTISTLNKVSVHGGIGELSLKAHEGDKDLIDSKVEELNIRSVKIRCDFLKEDSNNTSTTEEIPNLPSAPELKSKNTILSQDPLDEEFASPSSVIKTALPKFNTFSALFLDEPPEDDEFFQTIGTNAINQTNFETDIFDPPTKDNLSLLNKTEESKNASHDYRIGIYSDLPPDDDEDAHNVLYANQSQASNDEISKQSLPSKQLYDFEEPQENVKDEIDFQKNIIAKNKEKPLKFTVNIKPYADDLSHSSASVTTNKVAVSKLKMPKININVHALLPKSPQNPTLSKEAESEKTPENYVDQHRTDLLPNLCKNRIKVPVKRRKSTRAGRQESYRRSLLDDEREQEETYNNQRDQKDDFPTTVFPSKGYLKGDLKQENPSKVENLFSKVAAQSSNTHIEQVKLPTAEALVSNVETKTPNRNQLSNEAIVSGIEEVNHLSPDLIASQIEAVKILSNKAMIRKTDDVNSSKNEEISKAEGSNTHIVRSSGKIDRADSKSTLSTKNKLFGDSDDDEDFFTNLTLPKIASTKKKENIKSVVDSTQATASSKLRVSAIKKAASLFASDGDSDDDDLFKSAKNSKTNIQSASGDSKSKPVKTVAQKGKGTTTKSLFSDSEDDDDLFGSSATTKKSKGGSMKPVIAGVVNAPTNTKPVTLNSKTTDNPLADLLDS